MRLLFDQGTPVPLRGHLIGHEISTVFERGWSKISNGDLLNQAEADGFDILVTTDQNLRYQQHLSGRTIAIAVLMTTSWPRIERHIAFVRASIDALSMGEYVEIAIP